MVTVRGAAASAWLWMSGFGIVMAALLPGLSPYFVFPSVIAAVLLLATARAPGGWSGMWGRIALFVSALGALIIWIALVASGETLMGLQLHPLFTVPAAFALMTVVPLFARPGVGRISAAISGVIALAGAVIAGLMPAYSAQSPQRVDLIYFQNPAGSHWIADTAWKAKTTEPIPPALAKAGGFTLAKDAYPGLGMGDGYTAPASAEGFTLPSVIVAKNEKSSAVRFVTLALHGSPDADGMILYIPKAAKLQGIDLRGQHLVAPPDWSGATRLLCVSRDCRDETVKLTIAGDASGLVFAEDRYGLPPFGDALKAARPNTAMASQSGDQVMLANTISLK
jgi:hypothetical protein